MKKSTCRKIYCLLFAFSILFDSRTDFLLTSGSFFTSDSFPVFLGLGSCLIVQSSDFANLTYHSYFFHSFL